MGLMAIHDVAERQTEVVDESELKHAFSLGTRTQLEPVIVWKKIKFAVSLTVAFQ
jgi:hypothetical protein